MTHWAPNWHCEIADQWVWTNSTLTWSSNLMFLIVPTVHYDTDILNNSAVDAKQMNLPRAASEYIPVRGRHVLEATSMCGNIDLQRRLNSPPGNTNYIDPSPSQI